MMGVPRSEFATVLKCSNIILSNGDTEFIPEGTDPILAFLEAGATLTGIMEELGKFRIDHPSTTSRAPSSTPKSSQKN